MKILAHRGFWNDRVPANSREAFRRAWESGFGVETDIRDRAGANVISHDSPDNNACSLDQFLSDQFQIFPGALLALNVKADGMALGVAKLLEVAGVPHHFVFDMSVPDHLQWIQAGVPTYARWSDIERSPVLLAESEGLWLDSMLADWWWDPAEAAAMLRSGKSIAFVSPELHQREHLSVWDRIRTAGLNRHSNFAICTDYPLQAEGFFHDN